ncbi:MAG: polysaccharide deacetylase family protein [Prevotellaceae bacterium]|jgi:peptidoglycan/xylan/chitin deacetylase (PgdA/CDA1 family)|nr:polysaccharide deacetylase family protein [Prevotellaceae bacterium]
MRISPPQFIRNLFPNFIWDFPDEKDGIYLTFDDGPTAEVTPWVLDQLAKFNAKATFFCLGKNVEMNPGLFEQIKAHGHAVGNHSYSHIKGWGMDTGVYLRDVDLAESFIGNNLFRPPYARIGPHQARMVGERYNIIMWSILSRDYSRSLTGKACVRGVIKSLRPGDIVVFHDSRKSAKNLWFALPVVLDFIYAKGWKCKAIIM